MSNAKPDKEWRDTADANKDDELSTEEMDNVAGGIGARGPAAAAGKGFRAGPEDATDKGFRAGPEDAGDKGFHTKGPESSV